MTLNEVKAYLKIDGTDYDVVLQILLDAAVSKTQDYCSTCWEETEITEKRTGDGKVYHYLYRAPVKEISALTLDGTEVTGYKSYENGLIYDYWPKLSEVVITYTAGHDVTPPEAKLAVLMCVADWFNNPQGIDLENLSGVGSATFAKENDLPDRVKAKLSNLRPLC